MKTPLYCIALFFKFCPSLTLPRCLQPSLTLLFLLSSFFGWMGNHATWDALPNDIMELYMSNFGTLVPEGLWEERLWGLTHVAFRWCSDFISHTLANIHRHTHTHTHTHTQTHANTQCRSRGSIEWHTHRNIY